MLALGEPAQQGKPQVRTRFRPFRRGFGVELDAAYCDVAVARWEAFTGSKAVRMKT